MATASDLKYTRAIQNRLSEWVTNPSEDFVRLVCGDLLGSRRFTPAVKDQFTALARRAFEQLIGARINERLKGAMTQDAVSVVSSPILQPASARATAQIEALPAATSGEAASTVVTSADELEGFHSIRAILRDVVPAKRIFMRDAQSYCAILLDDNNRKPITRLRFNNAQKLRLGLFDANSKDEEIVDLSCIDDVFNFSDRLKTTVSAMLAGSDVKPS